jgi:hypothetical protein
LRVQKCPGIVADQRSPLAVEGRERADRVEQVRLRRIEQAFQNFGRLDEALSNGLREQVERVVLPTRFGAVTRRLRHGPSPSWKPRCDERP